MFPIIVLSFYFISAKDYRSALRILENPKKPLPQKRQVMRNSFGDYRAKMTREESKFKLDVSISSSSEGEKTSKFVKRKSEASKSKPIPGKVDHDSASGGFRFNFGSESAPGSS